jgi:3',5'-cyclic AMP phosphodiesterase CpdA
MMLLAQLTDLHIRMPGQKAYRVVETDLFLPPAVAHLNRLDPRPDMLIITGDLTDFGRPEEYAHLRAMLEALEMPYYLMPGNHDAREALRDAFPDHGYLRQMEGFLQYAVEAYPLRVLALDTVTPGMPHGELCAARLRWLEERLAEQPGRPTVIAMHHPPFLTGIAHMDAIGLLQGGDELRSLISRHPNVERVICGHVHRNIVQRYAGTVASICPSGAHQVALDLRADGPSRFVLEPAGFHLHLWRNDALVTHVGVIGEFGGVHAFHDDGKLID